MSHQISGPFNEVMWIALPEDTDEGSCFGPRDVEPEPAFLLRFLQSAQQRDDNRDVFQDLLPPGLRASSRGLDDNRLCHAIADRIRAGRLTLAPRAFERAPVGQAAPLADELTAATDEVTEAGAITDSLIGTIGAAAAVKDLTSAGAFVTRGVGLAKTVTDTPPRHTPLKSPSQEPPSVMVEYIPPSERSPGGTFFSYNHIPVQDDVAPAPSCGACEPHP